MNTLLNQLTDRIRHAASHQTALCIRGAGSKDFYGHPTQGELLDTRGYRGIVSYEPSELVVTVRAGTPLRELEAALAEKISAWPLSRRALPALTARRVALVAAWWPLA